MRFSSLPTPESDGLPGRFGVDLNAGVPYIACFGSGREAARPQLNFGVLSWEMIAGIGGEWRPVTGTGHRI